MTRRIITARPTFVPNRPDGRWSRVLAACARAPRHVGEINRQVRRYGEAGLGHSREKLKTITTVRSLVAAGLLANTGNGFIATPSGLALLAREGPGAAPDARPSPRAAERIPA